MFKQLSKRTSETHFTSWPVLMHYLRGHKQCNLEMDMDMKELILSASADLLIWFLGCLFFNK